MDDDPEDPYTAQVASSDIYLGILGSRYGKPLKTGYSATHAECNEAVRRGLRISIWTTTADQDGRQRDFLDEIRVFPPPAPTRRPTISPSASRNGCGPSPRTLWPPGSKWATQYSERPASATTAGPSPGRPGPDNSVAASLLGPRPDTSYGRNSDTRITWPGGTSAVRVKTVESETTSTRRPRSPLTAERTAENRSNLLEMGMEGRTPDDLTEPPPGSSSSANPIPSKHVVHGERHEPASSSRSRRAARGLGGIGWAAAGHRTARRRARCRPHHLIPFGTQAVGPAPAQPGVDAPQALHQRGASRAVHRRRNASAEHPLEEANGLRPALQDDRPPRRLSAFVVKSLLSNLCRMLNEC